MINLTDRNVCPSLEEIGEYIGNPVFLQFCAKLYYLSVTRNYGKFMYRPKKETGKGG